MNWLMNQTLTFLCYPPGRCWGWRGRHHRWLWLNMLTQVLPDPAVRPPNQSRPRGETHRLSTRPRSPPAEQEGESIRNGRLHLHIIIFKLWHQKDKESRCKTSLHFKLNKNLHTLELWPALHDHTTVITQCWELHLFLRLRNSHVATSVPDQSGGRTLWWSTERQPAASSCLPAQRNTAGCPDPAALSSAGSSAALGSSSHLKTEGKTTRWCSLVPNTPKVLLQKKWKHFNKPLTDRSGWFIMNWWWNIEKWA